MTRRARASPDRDEPLVPSRSPRRGARPAQAHLPYDSAPMASAPTEAALPILPSQEETLLREAVAGICAEFGQDYMQRKRDEAEPPRELWDALASRGYMGVNIPEAFGGGGLGMTALSWVGEEIAAAGCSLLLIVVSPAIVGNILDKHGTLEQKERWLRGIGA